MPDLLNYACNSFSFRYALDESLYPGTYIMHTHEETEIYVFVRGKGKYIVEGTEYSLMPRDILIMRNAEAHMPVMDENEPYERVVFSINPSFLDKLDPSKSILRPIYDRSLGDRNRYHACDYPDFVWAILEQIMHCPYADTNLLRLLLIGAATTILTAIAHAFDSDIHNDLQKTRLETRIIQYVNAELGNDLSLDKISERFYISKSQLCKIFKEATGTSLWEYVSIKRLISAREMILSGVSAKNACISSGFHDYSAFYRAYKSKFHVSPGHDKAPHVQ